MPKQLSTITVFRAVDNPHRFILVRTDLPSSAEYVWCGKANGWQPWNATTDIVAHRFRTEAAATRAADKVVTLPLQE